MPFIEHDLKTLLADMPHPFMQSEVKTLMLQLCSAVAHCHANWIVSAKSQAILIVSCTEISKPRIFYSTIVASSRLPISVLLASSATLLAR
jgi:serine/threonine protein kinase